MTKSENPSIIITYREYKKEESHEKNFIALYPYQPIQKDKLHLLVCPHSQGKEVFLLAEKFSEVKAAVSLFLGAVSAALGWFGWLVMLYASCMVIDWVTGSLAAKRNHEWKSSIARDGIWHKGGSIAIVLVSLIADALIGRMVNYLPGLELPFSYGVMICPIVLVWYIVAEMGSIVENGIKMGSAAPAFLRKMIAAVQKSVDSAGNAIISENTPEPSEDPSK